MKSSEVDGPAMEHAYDDLSLPFLIAASLASQLDPNTSESEAGPFTSFLVVLHHLLSYRELPVPVPVVE